MTPRWRRERAREQVETPYAEQLTERARSRLDPAVFAYVSQGAAGGESAAEASPAWRRVRFLPRILQDVTAVETRTHLLGHDYGMPVGIAPTTLQRAAHPEGEVEMARGAAAAEVPLVVSSNAGSRFDAIAATGATWWLQMYVTADRSLTEPVVDAAKEAGASAIVLTADTPVVARKRLTTPNVWDVVEPGWLRVNFPGGDSDEVLDKAGDLGPHDIAWLSQRFDLPVVVKGVLHPDDARRCVQAGARAVWVSNHGGRQLDRAVSSALALPAVAQTVRELDPEAEVYADGGVRGGLDVLAALALGARAVFLGRPAFYALADDGAAGVQRLWGELGEELEEALRLVGVGSVHALTSDLVVPDRSTTAWPAPDGGAVEHL
jgi:4-hydroxymandelate oxidase